MKYKDFKAKLLQDPEFKKEWDRSRFWRWIMTKKVQIEIWLNKN